MSSELVGYEVWVDYAPTAHRGATYVKQGRRFGGLLFDSLEEVSRALIGAEDAEAMSRRMAQDLGHPHHDATFRAFEVRTTRTPIPDADLRSQGYQTATEDA